MNAYIIIIFVLIIFGVIAYWQYKTKFIWEFQRREKWKALQPDIQNIYKINERVEGRGKKIDWFDKNLSKSTKKSFYESKNKYNEYINFCQEKKLRLPDNHQEIEGVIDKTEDTFLSPDKILDKELNKVGEQYNEAYTLVSDAGEKLLSQRRDALVIIEDIEELINSIAAYPKSFSTDINEIKVEKEQFKNTIEYGVEQKKALEASAKNVGAGVAAGAAVASMAPTAAMWVATTFGTASTGTAISALSGAAATNAALAWLGGGAIAAGGGGMAAGQALLALAGPIGWGVAGTSVLVSVLFVWRKKHKIQESKRDEIVRLKNCVESLKEIKGRIDSISIETNELYKQIKRSLYDCNSMRGKDYTKLSDKQKMKLGAIVNNTKSLSALLNKTVSE